MKSDIWRFVTSSGMFLDYEGCFLQTRLSKTLNVSIKRLGRAFVSKHATEPLKGSDELLKHSVEVWGFKRKLKARQSLKVAAGCLKSSAGYLCYNTAHAVLISHHKILRLLRLKPNILRACERKQNGKRFIFKHFLRRAY